MTCGVQSLTTPDADHKEAAVSNSRLSVVGGA